MQCPRDQSELRSERYEGEVRVDACPACSGIWLEKRELEQIEEAHEHKYSAELAQMVDLGYNAYELAKQRELGPIHCPRCKAEMESREYARCSQVLIDVCPSCHGIWLDRGELEALELFFERSRYEAAEIRRGFLASLRSMFRT